jgi:hypothetical protein
VIRVDHRGLPGVIVAEGVGEITADDYTDRLIPAIENASKQGAGKLRLLLVLGPDFEGYEGGAALEDAKLGIHHWSSFERIGLVTDHEGYATAAKALGFLMPGEVRTFPVARLDEAREWVGAGSPAI